MNLLTQFKTPYYNQLLREFRINNLIVDMQIPTEIILDDDNIDDDESVYSDSE